MKMTWFHQLDYLIFLVLSIILSLVRGVAQMEARRVWDAEVGGSSPPTPTGLTAELRSP